MSGGVTPIRMCMVCKRRFPKPQLLRHVLLPADGEDSGEDSKNALVADAVQTRPGRGWYVCSDPACRERFAKMGRVRRKRKGVSRNG